MCGICGIVDLEGGLPLEHLAPMADSLRHRGPDAFGELDDHDAAPSIALGQRRLSVIDLSEAANQPLANEAGTVWAVLNGEIYNFQDLRRELESKYHFRTSGDTEVIVNGYAEWGEDVVARLDGMFAFALWDKTKRRLLLARDRFGKKPLYWYRDGKRVFFASEIKGLLAAGVPAEMEPANLPEFLSLGYVPTPRTLFKNIEKFPPASFVLIDHGGVGPIREFWRWKFPTLGQASTLPRAEARDRVRSLLEEAVKRRLVADVPLGVLLSGGVDSSAVAVLAQRHLAGRLRTFTVGFSTDPRFDERPHAAIVAKMLGSEHHESVVESNAAQILPALVDHHDEPFGDSSALPTYLVAREARRHVTVVLNGDGGDELFAGYGNFRAALLAERIGPTGLGLARGVVGAIEGLGFRGARLQQAARFLDKARRPRAERFLAWSSFMDASEVRRLVPQWFDAGRLLSSYQQAFSQQAGASLLSQLLYVNAKTYLLDDLLPKMDRMAMAHGLEARSPFLDTNLAEFAATLPDGYKREGAQGKVILRESLAPLFPPGFLDRKKQGFGVPIHAWFRGDLKEMTRDLLRPEARLSNYLDKTAIAGLIDAHLSGTADRGDRIWSLLTLELWLRKHRF